MIQMEIALILVLAMISIIFFSSERNPSKLHKLFSAVLIAVMVNLFFDGIVVYIAGHLEKVSLIIYDIFYRFYLGTLILVLYLFFQYIYALTIDEERKRRIAPIVANIFMVVIEIGIIVLPFQYAMTSSGSYVDGTHELSIS